MAHDHLHPDARTRRDVGMALVTFFVFAVLGPPLGVLTMLAGTAPLAALSFPFRQPAPHELAGIAKIFTVFGLFSYVFGGAQAAFVGLVAAISQYRSRRLSLLTVLLACLAAGAAFLVFVAFKWPRANDITDLAAFLGIHLGAGVGCWLIANLLLWPFRRSSIGRA